MARIPVPDRGQPLDVSYIYQIVEAVNELAQTTASSTYKYASIDTTIGNQTSMISDMKVVAGEKIIYSTLTNVTIDSTYTFTYSFNGEYKYPPVVTATPVLLEGTAAGQDVSVVIQNVTNSQVTGVVNFNSNGAVALKVNIIAIGLPN